MDESNRINKFIVFCLENYKNAAGISGMQALADFQDYGVFEYLSNGYEVLHTQGEKYLVVDIKNFLYNRKNK